MTRSKAKSRTAPLAAVIALAGTAVTVSGPAQATVYEIGDDGQVHAVGTQKPGLADGIQGSVTPDAAPDVPTQAITTIAEPSVPAGYRQPLLDASQRYALSPRLLAALARRESAWRAAAVSSKGAIGLTQLMPGTARDLAVDPRDPSANLAGGAHYLRQLIDRFDGNIERALAAYNAGPARVARTDGLPAIAETRTYVTGIVDRLGVAALDGERD